jgi:hypothetical protein
LVCQNELFANNPLDVKENNEHVLDLTCLAFSSVSASLDFSIGRIVALFQLSEIALGQIHDSKLKDAKNQHVGPAV